ncbi:MAG: hypothetical protein AB1921_09320 [Thermodesulfobacteriota bacterium]
MDWIKKIGRMRARFEISAPGAKPGQEVCALSFAEFARMAPEVAMKRRGFLALSLFAQAAALAASVPAFGQETKSGKKLLHGAIPSIILMTDYGADVVCIQEAGSNRQICMKVVPPRSGASDAIKKLDQRLTADLSTVFFVPDLGVSSAGIYPVASLGKVTRVDLKEGIVCAKNTIMGNDVCARLVHGDIPYQDEYLDSLGSLKPGDTALLFEHYDEAAYARLPLSLRVIHLTNGGRIPCLESWIEERMLHYSTGFGSVAVPLSQVDMGRSVKETVQIEVEESYARNASAMSRRAETRARDLAEKSRKALMMEEERHAEEAAAQQQESGKESRKVKGSSDKARATKKGADNRIEEWKRFDETDDCGKTSSTCSCVPVCYY